MQSARPDDSSSQYPDKHPKKPVSAHPDADASRAIVPTPSLDAWTVWEPDAESTASGYAPRTVTASAQPAAAEPAPFAHESVHTGEVHAGEVIDGHTAPVEDDVAVALAQHLPDRSSHPISDVVDEILIGRLGARLVAVEPGEVAAISLSLLNNSREPVEVKVQVEGWVDERWFPDLPLVQTLEPGVWTTLAIAIAPPREPHSWAGAHDFAFTLHSPQYPDRMTRLAATVEIAPFAEFSVSGPAPDLVASDGNARMGTTRMGTTRIHIHNRGNETVRYRIWGISGAAGARDSQPRCEFAFRAVGDPGIHPDWLEVDVEPGALLAVGCRISGVGMPPLGPFAQSVPFRLVVAPVDMSDAPLPGDGATARKVVGGQFEQRPLVGIWLLGALLILLVGAVVFAAIVGIMAILSLQAGPARAVPPADAEPPVVAIMLHMDEILPQPVESSPGESIVLPPPAAALDGNLPPLTLTGAEPIRALPAVQSAGTTGAIVPVVQPGDISSPNGAVSAPVVSAATVSAPGDDGALPVVQAGQVSVPGVQPSVATPQNSAAIAPPAPVQTVPSENGASMTTAPSENGASMTYAQMFQDVAWRFDLDWRMLAAQAYVESSFDSLALGSRGSMGLMQIQPQTWREFAPSINAVDPFDSYSNTLVAGLYLDYLRIFLAERGYPQVEWMLVAYNWGPDQLLGYLNAGGDWAGLPAEVRGYAEDVLRIARTLPSGG